MNSFCGTPFWDLNVTWYTNSPDFTQCFQETALVLAPCVFLWIFSSYEIARICKYSGRRYKIPWTFLNISKITISSLLAALSLADLIHALSKFLTGDYFSYPVYFYMALVKVVTFVYVVILNLLQRKNGIHNSGVLFLFWLFLTVSAVISFRSVLLMMIDNYVSKLPVIKNKFEWLICYQNGYYHGVIDEFNYITRVAFFPLVTSQLVLSAFSDSVVSDFIDEEKGKSPEESASFLSQITFNWLNNLILKGYRRPLTQDDVWRLSEDNLSENIVYKFERNWIPVISKAKIKATVKSLQTSEELATNASIVKPILKTFWPALIWIAILKIIASLMPFVSPIVMNLLITFVSSDEPVWRGYFYAFLMFLAPMIESLLNSQYEFGIQVISMRVRACLISTIYKKGIKLSTQGKKDYTVGEIVNLMSVDTQRLMDYLNMINVLWSAPIQIAMCIYLLWQQLGIATLSGVGVMLLMIPFSGFITAKLRSLQVALMKEKDKRIKLINEILNGMKVLKLYAWEDSFKEKIMEFRQKEVKALNIQAFWQGGMVLSFSSATIFVSVASFVSYVLIDSSNVLDANKAFVSLTLFNILRMPLAFLPMLLAMGATALVSLRRINKYLNADEIDEKMISRDPSVKWPIVLENCSFSWSKNDPPTLKDISLQVKKRKLVAVVGQVGSGKSSLLSSILGDMYKLKGTININGSMAYVPQQAWIQNATLRQNILFIREMYHEFYNQVIKACALEADLKILAAGDMTEIGEKGINLSGGQKQRVSLARAVYQNADIYLFDDPLSAVDAHVGRHLFDQVIGPKGMLRDKTRVLVTHRISVLPHVDEIIVIKDGVIAESGTFEELVKQKGDFADFLAEHLVGHSEEEIDQEDATVLEAMSDSIMPIIEHKLSRLKSDTSTSDNESEGLRRRISLIKSGSFRSVEKEKEKPKQESKKVGEKKSGKLIETEGTESGSVKLAVYMQYMRAMGLCSIAMVLGSMAVSNLFQISSTLWLEAWSRDGLDPNKVHDIGLRNLRLGVYSAFGIADVLANLVATIGLSLACVRAAKKLHNSMLERVIRSPMSFFDTTPVGRILNRFSKDVDTADTTLLFNMRMMLMQVFRALVAFAMISLQTAILLAAVLPMTIIYYLVQKVYIATSRQLKRIESVSRSPVYNHFSETISGISSIRAYTASDHFISESNRRVDVNHRAYYQSIAATRWLSVRLEFLGYVIVFLTAIFSIIYRDTLSPGIVGISISYALNITMVLSMLVKAATDVETNVVSIERLLEYTTAPQEAAWHIEATKPKPKWPERGEIQFKDYSTRYRQGLELVLKKVSLKVESFEKVGVVGRTGAGKSSLTLALLRLIEPVEGTICIDEVDVTKLGLYDLRSKLTIIPQDPALFTGTLRLNLDPFDKNSDEELWKALELAHLKSFVQSTNKGLDYQITEGGDNLSVGQKQLVCLARALMKKSSILILDEATAAVDMETDDLIQETIRREFSECTIFTIAHRLNTIIDYDRILVLDKGEVAEFDTPKNLLKNTDSLFYSMAKEAGLV